MKMMQIYSRQIFNPVENQRRIWVLHVETLSLYDRMIVFDAISPFLSRSVFVFRYLSFPQFSLSDLKSNEVTLFNKGRIYCIPKGISSGIMVFH